MLSPRAPYQPRDVSVSDASDVSYVKFGEDYPLLGSCTQLGSMPCHLTGDKMANGHRKLKSCLRTDVRIERVQNLSMRKSPITKCGKDEPTAPVQNLVVYVDMIRSLLCQRGCSHLPVVHERLVHRLPRPVPEAIRAPADRAAHARTRRQPAASSGGDSDGLTVYYEPPQRLLFYCKRRVSTSSKSKVQVRQGTMMHLGLSPIAVSG